MSITPSPEPLSSKSISPDFDARVMAYLKEGLSIRLAIHKASRAEVYQDPTSELLQYFEDRSVNSDGAQKVEMQKKMTTLLQALPKSIPKNTVASPKPKKP